MPAAPSSPDEAKRLAAVKKLRLLGTPAEERFDAITRMARSEFDVPLACLDIVADKMVWLKSVEGFDGIEGLRKDSYCHYTVLSEGVCIVRDARSDPRVHDSILADSWVFYAGVPLHFEGQRVGALCIGDSRTRDLTASQFNKLSALAALAERELAHCALSEAQTALPRSDDELDMKARIDLLTHLWNRGAILEVAEAECRKASGPSPLALLMIGVQGLDLIKREFGQEAMDQVLRVIAVRLRATLRSSDASGRYEEGAFLAVLANAGERDAANISEEIRFAMANTPVQFGGRAIPVACKVGYAVSSGSADADSLIARATHSLR